MNAIAARWLAALQGSGATVIHEGRSAWVDAICREAAGLVLPAADTACLAVASGLAQAGRPVIVDLAGSARLLALRAALALPFAGAAVVLRVPWGGVRAPWLDAPCVGLLADVGARVVVPAHLDALQTAVETALAHPGLTVVLEHRNLADAPGDGGVASPDLCLLHLGPSDSAREAAAALSLVGLKAAVVDASGLPLAAAAVDAARAAGRPVVICDDPSAGAPLIAALSASDAFWHLHAQPCWVPARTDAIVAAARAAASDLLGDV